MTEQQQQDTLEDLQKWLKTIIDKRKGTGTYNVDSPDILALAQILDTYIRLRQ